MSDYIQVLTTADSEREAEEIGAALLERRLAACVQTLGPIVSRYRWRGKLELPVLAGSSGYLDWISANVG